LSSSQKEIEAQLTLKDRLNYPYYLGDAILTRSRSILKENFSEREIIEATENLRALIPKSWEDEEFIKAIKEAEITKKVDIRPSFCGIKPPVEYCEENGITIFREEKSFDYRKLYSACINLLDRRALTAGRKYVQKMTGNPSKGDESITPSDIEEL
jgi:hypothetical protein